MLNGSHAREFSGPLGKGYWLSRSIHVSPYTEVESRSWDTQSLGWVDISRPKEAGHFLVGGVATYPLSSSWMLSLDLAAGKPFLAEDTARQHLANTEDDDGDMVWRTRVKLGYALGANLRAFTLLERGTLKEDSLSSNRALQPHAEGEDTSLQLGLSYKFP